MEIGALLHSCSGGKYLSSCRPVDSRVDQDEVLGAGVYSAALRAWPWWDTGGTQPGITPQHPEPLNTRSFVTRQSSPKGTGEMASSQQTESVAPI